MVALGITRSVVILVSITLVTASLILAITITLIRVIVITPIISVSVTPASTALMVGILTLPPPPLVGVLTQTSLMGVLTMTSLRGLVLVMSKSSAMRAGFCAKAIEDALYEVLPS